MHRHTFECCRLDTNKTSCFTKLGLMLKNRNIRRYHDGTSMLLLSMQTLSLSSLSCFSLRFRVPLSLSLFLSRTSSFNILSFSSITVRQNSELFNSIKSAIKTFVVGWFAFNSKGPGRCTLIQSMSFLFTFTAHFFFNDE